LSSEAIASAARAGSAAPESTAHDWAIESIRLSSFSCEPIATVEDSKCPVGGECMRVIRGLRNSFENE
jgi:hypothetical protein